MKNLKSEMTAAILADVSDSDAVAGSDFVVGETSYFMTVTYHFTGRLVKATAAMLYIEDASWIPNTSRFQQFLERGEINECEPIPGIVRIPIGSLVGVCQWNTPLPKQQK